MVEKYSIRSRAHRCHVTDKVFAEGEVFVAAIFPDPEAEGYLRRDYSPEAWANREEEAEPFSFWKSHYKPPVKEEETQVTSHDPETLFAKLVEENEEHTENARFILAAMLERKKLIRETDTQQLESTLLRIYEHRKTGDVFIVKDPQIALSDVDSIQEQVHRLLDPESYLSEEVTSTEKRPPEPEQVEPADPKAEPEEESAD